MEVAMHDLKHATLGNDEDERWSAAAEVIPHYALRPKATSVASVSMMDR